MGSLSEKSAPTTHGARRWIHCGAKRKCHEARWCGNGWWESNGAEDPVRSAGGKWATCSESGITLTILRSFNILWNLHYLLCNPPTPTSRWWQVPHIFPWKFWSLRSTSVSAWGPDATMQLLPEFSLRICGRKTQLTRREMAKCLDVMKSDFH